MTTRKQRTRVEWVNLIKQQEESGLKASQFCRQHKLNPQYFSKRKRQLGTNIALSPQASPFSKLQPPSIKHASASEARIVLNYQNIQLQMPVNIDPQKLALLMRALT